MSDVVLAVVSALATAAGSVGVYSFKEMRVMRRRGDEKIEALIALQLIVTRLTLMETHSRVIDRGAIYPHELDNWDKAVEAYHTLGGNGVVDSLDKEIDTVPIRR